MSERNDTHRFRLVREHVQVDEPWDHHEWWNPGRPITWRDAIGRRIAGGSYRWHYLECNNTDCPAEAMVREDVVTDLADEWDQRRRSVR